MDAQSFMSSYIEMNRDVYEIAAVLHIATALTLSNFLIYLQIYRIRIL